MSPFGQNNQFGYGWGDFTNDTGNALEWIGTLGIDWNTVFGGGGGGGSNGYPPPINPTYPPPYPRTKNDQDNGINPTILIVLFGIGYWILK